MSRRRGQGPQPQIRGFRPGKEPPQLKKQRAKQQFGEVSATQEKLIEMFAERTPDESYRMMRNWRVAFLSAGIVLLILGAVLFAWSVVAGVIVEVIAGAVLFLWWRFHRQRAAFEAMAATVSGGGKRKGQAKRKKK